MTYHIHNFHLSHHQIVTLSQGGTVRLAHEQLVGPHSIALTATQLNRVKSSHSKRKGVQLKLSNAQLHYHKTKLGGGLFSSLLKVAAPLVSKGLGAGASALTNFIASKNPTAGAIANMILPSVANMAGNALQSKMGGGIRRRRTTRKVGGSFLMPGQ